MRSIFKFSLALICTLPVTSMAFFCPTNFNQIQTGDTLEQVTALCGAPEKKEEKEIEPPVPQEWVYYIPQTVAANTTQKVQGTLQVSFSFDKNNKAVNISVNGIGVGASTICGKNIQLGATPDEVKADCGTPTFINKQEQTADTKKEEAMKMTTFIYTNPPSKLVFENGKLVRQEEGGAINNATSDTEVSDSATANEIQGASTQ